MKRGEEFIRIMNFVKADYSSAQEARLKGLCLFPTEPDIDGVEEEGIEDRIRSVLDYYQRIIQRDDDEPLYYTDLPDSLIHYPKGEYSPGEFEIDTLGYIIGSIRLFESRIDSLLPKQLPPVPSEILENADPEDIYGIYSESTYWWWQKGKREIHIVGTGSAETFEYYEEEYYKRTLLSELFEFLIDLRSIRKIVVHEGITAWSGVKLRSINFEEIVLPSSLKHLKQLNCSTDRLAIPESVNPFSFSSIVLDPYEDYDVETLVLPSTITVEHFCPALVESDLFLKKLELTGDQPTPDLNIWCEKGIIFPIAAKYLDVTYPSHWDQGIPGSYADQVIDYIRTKKPEKVNWYPELYGLRENIQWTNKDFVAIKKHFHPKG